MCGIVGITWRGGEDRQTLLLRSIRSLRHRGPDEAGIYVDDFLGMAHSRLTIVDAIGGRQPFFEPGRDEILVYNGEIFNYDELSRRLRYRGMSLKTRSDTELLFWMLVTFGRDAIRQLNGQFAFAFYSPANRSLLLGRDPFGEKPLFYTATADGIAFASEAKALFALGVAEPRLAADQVRSIARYWATVPSASAFVGIHQLPPGQSLLFRGGRIDIHSETIPLGDPPAAADVDLPDILSRAVSRRMRSDVPVALLLSGGLDSSIVGEEMRAASPDADLHTFSVGFAQAEFDERSHQSLMASHLRANHLRAEYSGSEMADDLDDAARAAEMPSPRLAFVALYGLHREINRRGIRVVLSGEGADEMFFGYDLFTEVFIQDEIRRGATYENLAPYIQTVNAFMANDPNYHRMGQLKFANYKALSQSNAWNSSHMQRASLGAKALALMPDSSLKDAIDEAWKAFLQQKYPGFRDLDDFRRAQILETETLLSGHLLSTQGDRVSMAHSVETRMPFLDPGLAAYSTAQDARQFFSTPNEKTLLKDLYRGRLPAAVLDRKKYPFRTPDSALLLSTERGRSFVGDQISDADSIDGLFDSSKVRGFLAKCLSSGVGSPRDNFAFVLLVTTMSLVRSLRLQQPPLEERAVIPRATTGFGTIGSIEEW